MIRVTKRRANEGRRVSARIDVRKRSKVFVMSPARLGMLVGSDITCVKLLTMAKASASRPAGLVTLEE